jgi:hypothetical protein
MRKGSKPKYMKIRPEDIKGNYDLNLKVKHTLPIEEDECECFTCFIIKNRS